VEIQQLRCFVAVAEEGSFTKAAQVLDLSQPSLSQSVSRLEAEFRTELFVRGSRGVTLTADGHLLLDRARQVMATVDSARSAVDARHGITTGRLVVACFNGFTTTMAQVVAEFCARYPAVHVAVRPPAPDDQVFEWIGSGRCDAGFTRAIEHPPEVVIDPIALERTVALVPKESPVGGTDRPITLPELSQLPIVVAPAGTGTRRATEEVFAELGGTLRVAAESAHHESSIQLVRRGVGGYLTARSGLPAGIEEIVTVRPLSPRREWPVGLVLRPGVRSPAEQAFADTVHGYFGAAQLRASRRARPPRTA
jgi:DNA-binding transcriptional LysR family regulator